MNKVASIYQEKIQKYQLQYDELQKKSNTLAFLRLFSFLISIVSFVLLASNGFLLEGVLAGFVLLSLFLVFVKLNLKVNHKKKKTQKLLDYNRRELNALNYDFKAFENGEEFLNINHAFSNDLDVFGQGSVFQMLNRCTTKGGKIVLAKKLNTPLSQPSVILAHQNAVKELSRAVDWRQDFWSEGQLFKEEINDKKEIEEWLMEENHFYRKKIFHFLIWALPVFTIATIILSIFSFFPSYYAGMAFVVHLVVTGAFLKKVNRIHGRVSRKFELLKKYAGLFTKIESRNFETDYLKSLKDNLSEGKKSAFLQFHSLSKIVNALDSRLNIIVAVALNGLLTWDIRNAMRLEKWKYENKELVSKWFDVLSELDAICCLSNYAFNFQEFTFPKIEDNFPLFEAKKMGHPLIQNKQRVDNDFHLMKRGKFCIITGANMAGKSTFLRTVGVNILLAFCGAPVCAESLTMSPFSLFTSMRTNDSLQKNESYFYTELKRLQFLIQQIDLNENVFFLLDEILKGTNSIDKQKGSKAFLQKLIRMNASGIIATHDLELAKIEKEYPDKVKNQCFEIEINGADIKFDFLLRSGVTQKMNASLLLQQMGLI